MSRHFRIPDVLPEPVLLEFRGECMREKNTVDNLVEWLRSRGYRISRGAVHNFRSRLLEYQANPDTTIILRVLRLLMQQNRPLDGSLRAEFEGLMVELNRRVGAIPARSLMSDACPMSDAQPRSRYRKRGRRAK